MRIWVWSLGRIGVELAPDEIMERIAGIATTNNDTDIDTE